MSAVTLPAQTIAEVVSDLIESGSISVGAERTAQLALVAECRRRGIDPVVPIDGDLLDLLVVDAIPSHLWTA